jgi:hypothetical protein
MKIRFATVLAVLLAPALVSAAEYYIYKDQSGVFVLSNLPASARPAQRAPESLALANVYNLPDVTAEEIAASERENEENARLNAMRDLAAETERLAMEIRRLSDLVLVSLQRPTEINQVAVTQGAAFSRFGFRR